MTCSTKTTTFSLQQQICTFPWREYFLEMVALIGLFVLNVTSTTSHTLKVAQYMRDTSNMIPDHIQNMFDWSPNQSEATKHVNRTVYNLYDALTRIPKGDAYCIMNVVEDAAILIAEQHYKIAALEAEEIEE